MTTQLNRIFLMGTTFAAVALLHPSDAAASLPGWGTVTGDPFADDSWCHGAGRNVYQGDFNGDGRTDILCHNSSTGRKRIDFADPEYQGFWGTDWDTIGSSADQDWCSNSGEQIFVGDFNGDGKDDLLCYVARGYPNAGRKRIDFANSEGTFFGTEFNTENHDEATQTWCTNAGESMFVGDFDGDGKDDLLCHVARGYANAGRRRIDFANSSGTFFGTDFNSEDFPMSASQTWCTNEGETLHVGDFNGDGKSDLLCFVNRGYTNAGRRRVDFANSSGTLFGTDFNSDVSAGADPSWCVSYGDELTVGDTNRDGKDDLLCVNWDLGGIRVDHANSSGGFYGTNGTEHWEAGFCTSGYENVYASDFDGDGGADVLCHDPTTGYRGIRYANLLGDFYSICADSSVKGDGQLGPIPVHFVVAADPNHPDVPARAARMPTASSTHVNPLTGNGIFQILDTSNYFRAEIDVINEYTYDDTPAKNPVCVGSDCIVYQYESHSLYDEVSNTSCTGVLDYSNPPDGRYGANCAADGSNCYPNSCNYGSWNMAYGCTIAECDDPLIRRPGALTVVVMDRCNWDFGTDELGSCGIRESFGLDAPEFLTAWDYDRMLRGPMTGDRDVAQGVEQHELGHVLSLGHTYDCVTDDGNPFQNENAMYKGSSALSYTCDSTLEHPDTDGDGIARREGGYSYDIVAYDNGSNGPVNQVDDMVTAAREQMVEWACN